MEPSQHDPPFQDQGIEPRKRPRYRLEDLLAESDYSQPRSPEEQEWLDLPPVGKELP
jgi:antitoxin ChpS